MSPHMKGPLLIWSSILVMLQVLTGGAALGDFVGLEVAGLLILIVASFQAATQFYINGMLTLSSSVAAEVVKGEVVAGPAARQLNGTPVDLSTPDEVLFPREGPGHRA